jgi:glycoprotein endo-alpha-1,2-mannosidase
MIFIPSIGPGYEDTRIRPCMPHTPHTHHRTRTTAHRISQGPADARWGELRTQTGNAKNSRSREEGKYYERMMSAAFNLDKLPEVISITSWNEWHEVTFLFLASLR